MKKIMNYAFVFLMLASAASAAVPGYINFQGRLLDPDKLPRNGSFPMTFRICNSLAGTCAAPCGTGCLWYEDQTVAVANGVFAVQLGSFTALTPSVFSAETRFLQITVNGEILSPREALAAGPYSFRASLADGLVADALDNSQVAPAAGIAYSKLNLAGAVLNTDLAGSIDDTKLNQITTANKVAVGAIANGTLAAGVVASSVAANGVRPGSIVAGAVANADINASAAVSISKLATTGNLGANVIVSSLAVNSAYTGSLPAGAVTEAKLGLSDVTTANVSISQHGLTPKAPNVTTQFLRGDATWAQATTSKFVVKSADENVPSGTTLISDAELFFPVLSGETWIFEFRLIATNFNNATPDWKSAVLGAVGWTCKFVLSGSEGAGTAFPQATSTDCDNAPTAAANIAVSADAGFAFNVYMQGWITATTNGNVTLQWAPNTSGSLTVLKGSYVVAQKVGGI